PDGLSPTRLDRARGRTLGSPHSSSRRRRRQMDCSRRDVLKLGGLTLAATTLRPGRAHADTPKRGGTITIRAWDPPHFDLHAGGGFSYKTQIVLSFTHSRLILNKSDPSVSQRALSLRGPLAT